MNFDFKRNNYYLQKWLIITKESMVNSVRCFWTTIQKHSSLFYLDGSNLDSELRGCGTIENTIFIIPSFRIYPYLSKTCSPLTPRSHRISTCHCFWWREVNRNNGHFTQRQNVKNKDDRKRGLNKEYLEERPPLSLR